jgi:hypothetical protein
MWLLIPLSFINLAFIFYLAISKKSSPTIRRLAVIALIIAAIALIVSVIFIATATPQEAEPGLVTLPLVVKPVAPVQRVNWRELIIFSVLFLLFLLFLLSLALRNKPPKAGKDGS